MNQIAAAGDLLALKRREAARKAVETRRARMQGMAPPVQTKAASVQRCSHSLQQALAAFDLEAASQSPDWHKAALALKRVLTERPAPQIRKQNLDAVPAPVWHDYPVNGVTSFKLVNPTIIVTFADGEVVRAPAVSRLGKPTNVGRGLRIAIAFYQARKHRERGLRYIWPPAPDITACVCEDTGERYDPEQCTIRTVQARRIKRR
ncbi:hypothetical protein [Bradyrhizobium sp. SZCCHNRI1002]|uniref:hypothetical protein n=1 Tax=Bradyrhizobium sp. SZCCHNRI1002 TaxID=3057274 RepID=UPI0028EBD750|nr:hypothetical protein [Bradyrhizobium sp. SZCCHNRI1002]